MEKITIKHALQCVDEWLKSNDTWCEGDEIKCKPGSLLARLCKEPKSEPPNEIGKAAGHHAHDTEEKYSDLHKKTIAYYSFNAGANWYAAQVSATTTEPSLPKERAEKLYPPTRFINYLDELIFSGDVMDIMKMRQKAVEILLEEYTAPKENNDTNVRQDSSIVVSQSVHHNNNNQQ